MLISTILQYLQTRSRMPQKKPLSMLSLGDSYTIGEMVAEEERFPVQTKKILKKDGIIINEIKIIAKTGWTTDELIYAIEQEGETQTFDLVTLLIGVNNQYRGLDPENFRKEFKKLLQTAVHFAGGRVLHVYVLSIPDWGATPFATGRDLHKIAFEIEQFNKIKKEESVKAGVHFIPITDISREAPRNPKLLTTDYLHPSGEMYALWAKRLAEAIKNNKD